MLTYQDYLKAVARQQGSEGGSVQPMTEAEWNRLSLAQRWNTVQQLVISPEDARYAQLATRVGGEPGRNIMVEAPRGMAREGAYGSDMFTDPNAIDFGEDYTAYNESNRTPANQAQDDVNEKAWYAAWLAAMGGAGLSGLGAGAAGAGEGLGLSATGELGVGAGASGSAGFSGLGGGGLGALGAAAGGGGGGGGLGLTATGELGSGAGNAVGTGLGTGGTATVGDSTLGNIVNSLGGPGNIARLGMGLAALGGSSGGGPGGGGNSSDANDIIEQMARANRVDHTTPLGSRRWTQGPDGRWSVTDAMDPTEELNFRQVQGMNADVTGMARSRLAQLLAAGPRPRYDRPLGT